jgi:hypothetical protein
MQPWSPSREVIVTQLATQPLLAKRGSLKFEWARPAHHDGDERRRTQSAATSSLYFTAVPLLYLCAVTSNSRSLPKSVRARPR